MLVHSIALVYWNVVQRWSVINSGMYAKFLQHGSQNLAFITIVQNGFTHYALVKMQILEFLVCDDSYSDYQLMYYQSFSKTASTKESK